MSRLVARILLSILMFPLAGLFYIVSMMLSEMNLRSQNYPARETEMFLISGVLTWGVVAFYWCLLWKSSVKWDSFRIGGTFAAAGGAIAAGAGMGLIVGMAMGRTDGEPFGSFIGGILAIIVWLIATIVLWRETPAERTARIKSAGKSAVACPTCGYNMTGLTEPRCPECGSKFTLDELMAAQVHEAGDVE